MSDLTKLVEKARKSMVADGLLGVFEGRTPDQANDDAVNILTALAEQAHAQGKVEGAIEELEEWIEEVRHTDIRETSRWTTPDGEPCRSKCLRCVLEARLAELREEQSK